MRNVVRRGVLHPVTSEAPGSGRTRGRPRLLSNSLGRAPSDRVTLTKSAWCGHPNQSRRAQIFPATICRLPEEASAT
jgi:hypothetical protein